VSSTGTTRRPAHDLALIAVFVGVMAALGLVPAIFVPGFPAPITLQSMGVVLAGAVLGPRRGFLAILLFLGLVALGLPLLSGGRGGLGVFTTPYAGFLWAFPFAALLVGWLTYRRGAPYQLRWGIPVNLLGSVVLYVGGWLSLVTIGANSAVAALGLLVIYLPGDLVKMVVAALVARAVHSAMPDLLPAREESGDEVAVGA
jgi:biotin transport system substrate-specific component